MPIINSEPLFIVGEKSTLDRFNYNNLPTTFTNLRITNAAELEAIELRFKTLEKRQIFVSIGRNDARKGTPIHLFEKQIENFVKNLKQLYADQKFLNICYVRPRYHKDGVYENEQHQARYVSSAYAILLNNFPQTILFSQDSRDYHVSLAYRSLFFNMHKHPVAKEVIKEAIVEKIVEQAVEERVKVEAVVDDPISEKSLVVEPVPAPRVEYTKLYLYVYCRNLPNKGLGKIDPYVQISSESNVKITNSKTQTLDNNLNPTYFEDVLELEYSNLLDRITFKVKDEDIGKDDSIGELDIAVGKLLMNQGNENLNENHKSFGLNSFGYHELELSKGGLICVQALRKFEMEQRVNFSVAATGLPKMDTFGKADPYYQILLIDADKSGGPEYLQIFSSETLKKTLSPNWGESGLVLARLGEHGLAKKIIFKVWDWNNRSKDDYIGACTVTMAQVCAGHRSTLIDASKNEAKQNRGEMIFGNANESL